MRKPVRAPAETPAELRERADRARFYAHSVGDGGDGAAGRLRDFAAELEDQAAALERQDVRQPVAPPLNRRTTP